MDKNNMEEFAELKKTIKQLQEREKELKETIENEMFEVGEEQKEIPELGVFTLASRTSYTYSDKIKEMEEKVKIKKYDEEQKGVAEPKVTQYLRFTPVKNEA